MRAASLEGKQTHVDVVVDSHKRGILPYPTIRSDRQTTSLTLTTGVCEAGTKRRGASKINIDCDVTGLLTAVWRSHSGQIVWAA